MNNPPAHLRRGSFCFDGDGAPDVPPMFDDRHINQKGRLPNYHVIARRAKPDVAIPWSTERPLKIYGIATGYALAMTWEWSGLSKSTIFDMLFSRFYHEIFVDFLTICDTMRKSANADNSLLTTSLWAIKTIRRCKQHG